MTHMQFMTLVCETRRLHVAPDTTAAEMRLFAKYGPTTGAETPRRAITDQQSIVEKALAAGARTYGRGIEQPFAERGGRTVRIEDYERPGGAAWRSLERAQELGGDDTIGSRDGFRAGQGDRQ